MKRSSLIFSVLVLSLLGSCAPLPKLPQFTQDDYSYSELEIPGFPYNFIYLRFIHNFDDGTADGNFTLFRSDANVIEGGNFFSQQVGGQLKLSFGVYPVFDPDNPFESDSVAATLLVGIKPEVLSGVLRVPKLGVESQVGLRGPVSEEMLSEILAAFEQTFNNLGVHHRNLRRVTTLR